MQTSLVLEAVLHFMCVQSSYNVIQGAEHYCLLRQFIFNPLKQGFSELILRRTTKNTFQHSEKSLPMKTESVAKYNLQHEMTKVKKKKQVVTHGDYTSIANFLYKKYLDTGRNIWNIFASFQN